MIRDFFGIKKRRLVEEIDELRRQAEKQQTSQPVDLELLDAIGAVRQIGNIGAHMEEDINVIVDIDAGEAEVLLDLLEQIADGWYAERQKRTARIARVRRIAANKAEQKRPGTAGGEEGDTPSDNAGQDGGSVENLFDSPTPPEA